MSAFASGALLPPAAGHPDLVHVTRALAILAGVQRFDATSSPVQRVLECVGKPKHVIFVLLDGLGMNLLEQLPPGSFLRANLRMPLRATVPSTTACALTSIATGTWPSEHGVTGWYTHVPTRGVTVTTLHMVERFSGMSLADCGLDAAEFLPIPAFH
ncbi:MAG TPA: alkaline phosphatase family protein, partial [Polyangiaceae bacterium]